MYFFNYLLQFYHGDLAEKENTKFCFTHELQLLINQVVHDALASNVLQLTMGIIIHITNSS